MFKGDMRVCVYLSIYLAQLQELHSDSLQKFYK